MPKLAISTRPWRSMLSPLGAPPFGPSRLNEPSGKISATAHWWSEAKIRPSRPTTTSSGRSMPTAIFAKACVGMGASGMSFPFSSWDRSWAAGQEPDKLGFDGVHSVPWSRTVAATDESTGDAMGVTDWAWTGLRWLYALFFFTTGVAILSHLVTGWPGPIHQPTIAAQALDDALHHSGFMDPLICASYLVGGAALALRR